PGARPVVAEVRTGPAGLERGPAASVGRRAHPGGAARGAGAGADGAGRTGPAVAPGGGALGRRGPARDHPLGARAPRPVDRAPAAWRVLRRSCRAQAARSAAAVAAGPGERARMAEAPVSADADRGLRGWRRCTADAP